MLNHENDTSAITDVRSYDPSNFDEDVFKSSSCLLSGTSTPALSTHDEQPGSLHPQITTCSGRTVKPPQSYGT